MGSQEKKDELNDVGKTGAPALSISSTAASTSFSRSDDGFINSIYTDECDPINMLHGVEKCKQTTTSSLDKTMVQKSGELYAADVKEKKVGTVKVHAINPLLLHKEPIQQAAFVSSSSSINKRRPSSRKSSASTQYTATGRKRKSPAYLQQNFELKRNRQDARPGIRSANDRIEKTEQQRQKIPFPTDLDVVLGRGGRANNHPGNRRYLQELSKLKSKYRDMPKNAKSDISQMVVDSVHDNGGRFLKQDETTGGDWYEVPNKIAKKKASQALREAVKREDKHAATTTNMPRKNK